MLDRCVEQYFICHTPDILEYDAIGGDIRTIHYLIIIGSEVSIHIIEISVAAVKKESIDILMYQDFSQRRQMRIRGPAHDGLPRNRRRSQRKGFQPAYGTGACRIHLLKKQSVFRQGIQFWSQSFVCAIAVEVGR